MNVEQLRNEEEELRKKIALLSSEHKKKYYQMEEQLVKDPDTYAVLNYFFLTGLHHFYLKKYLLGLLNLFLLLFGIVSIGSFGLVVIFIVIIIELPQLFRSQSIIQQYNNNVMRKTLAVVMSPLNKDTRK